jgi:hypothetical protein
MASAIGAKLRERPGQRLSLVGMAFQRAAAMQIAMDGFRNSKLWPVDRCVFTDDDFAPAMITYRPETIQLER